MRRNTLRRSLGIAGVLTLGSIGIACAQQQPAPPASGASTALAAPAATAPVAPGDPPWPDVDCATAKLTTTASQPRCRRGPLMDWGRVLTEPLPGGCAAEQWSVATRSPSNFGYARLTNLHAAVARCMVRFGTRQHPDIAVGLKLGPVARNGIGWSDVNQTGGIYTASFTSAGGETASFTSVGGENCKAFLKYGPPWEGGFLWGVSGWLCGVKGSSVQDRDLLYFVDALYVKVAYINAPAGEPDRWGRGNAGQ